MTQRHPHNVTNTKQKLGMSKHVSVSQINHPSNITVQHQGVPHLRTVTETMNTQPKVKRKGRKRRNLLEMCFLVVMSRILTLKNSLPSFLKYSDDRHSSRIREEMWVSKKDAERFRGFENLEIWVWKQSEDLWVFPSYLLLRDANRPKGMEPLDSPMNDPMAHDQ